MYPLLGLPHPSLFPIKKTGMTLVDPFCAADNIPELETKEIQVDSNSVPPLAKFLQYGQQTQ